MIFSSHNYKYKPVVEQVAIKQCAIYGLQILSMIAGLFNLMMA